MMRIVKTSMLLISILAVTACGARATSKPVPVAKVLSEPIPSKVETVAPPLTGPELWRSQCTERAGIFGPYKYTERKFGLRTITEARLGPTVDEEQKADFDTCMDER